MKLDLNNEVIHKVFHLLGNIEGLMLGIQCSDLSLKGVDSIAARVLEATKHINVLLSAVED